MTLLECLRPRALLATGSTHSKSFITSGWGRKPPGTRLAMPGSNTSRDFGPTAERSSRWGHRDAQGDVPDMPAHLTRGLLPPCATRLDSAGHLDHRASGSATRGCVRSGV